MRVTQGHCDCLVAHQFRHENSNLAAQVHKLLSSIPVHQMTAEGRVYGGGLHKLEARELANVPADEIARVLAAKPMIGEQVALGTAISNRLLTRS